MLRSDPVNPDVRLEKEAKSLAKYGHSVTVLGWDRSINCSKFECKDGYTICRLRLKAPYGKISLVPSLFLWNLYIIYFLSIKKHDAIHACNLDTLIPALIIGKFRRKKIIYDIFDFYGPMLPKSTPDLLRNLISVIESSLLRFPDCVILVDESRLKQLTSNKFKKMEFILNTPELVYLNTQNNENKKFIIFYGGVLLESRGLKQVIEISRKISNIELVIAGYGAYEKSLLPLFSLYDNIKFLGKLPHDKVIENTYKADLLFALYNPTIPNNKFASPNKLFEAMMCSKPILVNKGTSMAKIVEEEKCGLVVDYFDNLELQEAILYLMENEHLRVSFGNNGRCAYEKKYNWKIMEQKLVSLYSTL